MIASLPAVYETDEVISNELKELEEKTKEITLLIQKDALEAGFNIFMNFMYFLERIQRQLWNHIEFATNLQFDSSHQME